MSIRNLERALLALLALSSVAPAAAQAQFGVPAPPARSGIAGTVRDNLGHPVPAARVLIDGSKLSSASDDSGRFDLRGLPPGPTGFTITKIGYAPVSFETKLMPDSVIVVAIQLRAVQVLNTVAINAARADAFLKRVGFTERQHLGLGSFFGPEKVDSMARLVRTVSGFFRDVRGIDVHCVSSNCAPVPRNQPGCLWLFIDGAPHGFASQIDSLGYTPDGLAAIEVYDRPSVVPSEFQGAMPQKAGNTFSIASGCGAIALWTKSRIR